VRFGLDHLHRLGGAGIRSGAGGPAYSASKAGVISLVKTSANELYGTGVRVNAVAPGLIETGMTKPIFDGARARGNEGKIGQLNPLTRYGVPDEIAHAGLFLASDDALLRERTDHRGGRAGCRPPIPWCVAGPDLGSHDLPGSPRPDGVQPRAPHSGPRGQSAHGAWRPPGEAVGPAAARPDPRARRLAHRFEPLGRAHATAEIISHKLGGLPVEFDDRLMEMSWGPHDGRLPLELEAEQPDTFGRTGWPFDASAGESYEAVAARIGSWLPSCRRSRSAGSSPSATASPAASCAASTPASTATGSAPRTSRRTPSSCCSTAASAASTASLWSDPPP